jgi:hypothetical protein
MKDLPAKHELVPAPNYDSNYEAVHEHRQGSQTLLKRTLLMIDAHGAMPTISAES